MVRLLTPKKQDFSIISSIVLILFSVGLLFLSGCADLQNMFKPTEVKKVEYHPTCKSEWKGKTIFIDFDTTASWYYSFAAGLSGSIKDQLIEDVVEDGCFNVQDRGSGLTWRRGKYAYRVSIVIARPKITVSQNNVIKKISATFRIKTYDKNNNLITAKKRDVVYNAPSFTVTTGGSQEKLIENYAFNVSQEIRKTMYASFK